MHDLLIHGLGARRVHWRYDDPSGVADADTRTARPSSRTIPVAAEPRLRVRRRPTPEGGLT